jgi:hypothetical protein
MDSIGFNQQLLNFVWYFIGFGFSLFAGLQIGHTQYLQRANYKEGILPNWSPTSVGLVERALYTASILAGFPAFIGVWLALKIVSHWDIFKSDYGQSEEKKTIIDTGNARLIFNTYLIGTGISIAYGGAGALIIRFLINHNYWAAIALGVSLVLMHQALDLYIWLKTKKNFPKRN